MEVKRSRAATTPLRAVTQPTQQRRLLAEEMPANAKGKGALGKLLLFVSDLELHMTLK